MVQGGCRAPAGAARTAPADGAARAARAGVRIPKTLELDSALDPQCFYTAILPGLGSQHVPAPKHPAAPILPLDYFPPGAGPDSRPRLSGPSARVRNTPPFRGVRLMPHIPNRGRAAVGGGIPNNRAGLPGYRSNTYDNISVQRIFVHCRCQRKRQRQNGRRLRSEDTRRYVAA